MSHQKFQAIGTLSIYFSTIKINRNVMFHDTKRVVNSNIFVYLYFYCSFKYMYH